MRQLPLMTNQGEPLFVKPHFELNIKPPLLKGAGVRWTPLRHSAEAPTEPTGETVAQLCCDEGIQKYTSLAKKDKC